MDDQQRFQEKPDWKGKLKEALHKRKEDVTGFIQRATKRKGAASDETAPTQSLAPSGTESAPYITDPSRPVPGALGNETGDGRTMTSLIRDHFQSKIIPKFAIFNRSKSEGGLGSGGGGLGGGGGGGFGVGAPKVEWNEKTLKTLSTLVAIVLIAWVGADLAAFYVEKLIPEPPASRMRIGGFETMASRSFSDYQVIVSRNLFSSLGRIPGDQVQGPAEQNNEPVKTSLPLNLIGTVILRNELRSVATIEDKGDGQVYPVRIDDELPGKIKILAIEPYKVVFRNLSSGRKEFIDMPEEGNGTRIAVGSLSSRTPTPGSGRPIEQTAPNTYNIAKTEIDRAMTNINEILTQARAVPHFENGQPAGYKLVQIVPGSIYEKLGLKNGDIICGANGESINDPSRALELMQTLKTAAQVELCVKRDGRTSNNTYNFK